MDNFVKVHVMHCGEIRVDRAFAFAEQTWHPWPPSGLFRPARYQICLPISRYLIEHPSGLIVVDTGFHEEARNPPKSLGMRMLMKMKPIRLAPDASIREQLARRNISPQDLAAVILSHRILIMSTAPPFCRVRPNS